MKYDSDVTVVGTISHFNDDIFGINGTKITTCSNDREEERKMKMEREVGPEVKNKLIVLKNNVFAATYYDGYAVDVKPIIPAIKNIKVLSDDDNETVGIIMYFVDGTFEKAICHPDDADDYEFDYEKSFMLCMFKKMIGLGKNNTAIANKLLRYAEKTLDNQLWDEYEAKLAEHRSNEIAERRRAKRKRKRERKQNEFINRLSKSIISGLKDVN